MSFLQKYGFYMSFRYLDIRKRVINPFRKIVFCYVYKLNTLDQINLINS